MVGDVLHYPLVRCRTHGRRQADPLHPRELKEDLWGIGSVADSKRTEAITGGGRDQIVVASWGLSMPPPAGARAMQVVG